MWMSKVYVMKNVIVTEMNVRENALIKQVKVANKIVNKMKQAVQEAEHKTKTWEENMHRLDNVVALACTNVFDEEITADMFPESKIIQIGDIVEDLCKKVIELEA